MKTQDLMPIVLIAGVGLIVWQMTKQKPLGGVPVPTGETKTSTTEKANITLDVWQGLTSEQLAALPVTKQRGTVGGETYYKTSQPVAIGDTGFKIWGMTESGAVVISKNDPAIYDSWEWMG